MDYLEASKKQSRSLRRFSNFLFDRSSFTYAFFFHLHLFVRSQLNIQPCYKALEVTVAIDAGVIGGLWAVGI